MMMTLNTALTLLYQISAHLVEQQNEVDGERHKQSQESQVVEVSGQIILETQVFSAFSDRDTTIRTSGI